MPAQVLDVFPTGNGDQRWRDELFGFLNNRIDQILEQTQMEKIEVRQKGIKHLAETKALVKFTLSRKLS